MKKSLTHILIITAAVLSAASCRQEISVTKDGMNTVEVTVGLPMELTSYAGGQLPEGGYSHLGGAYNVDPAQYDLRYIMEAWTDETPSSLAYRQTVTVDDDFINSSVKFTARLVAMEYNFIFWADFVPQGETGDYVYNTSSASGLQEITISEDRMAGNEYADAYYASKPVDLTLSGQSIGRVELTRPFGKIRLLATDRISDGAVQSEYPAQASVDFGNATVPASFNALTGLPLEQTITIGQLTAASTKENALVNGDEYPDSYLLGYYYIFAADQSTSYSMDVTCYDQNNNGIGTRNLSSIPLQKNKLTTVIGNFYTSEGSLEIIVEDPFEDAVYEVKADATE